jgi:addiction module RelB/DinJ family antitoxin
MQTTRWPSGGDDKPGAIAAHWYGKGEARRRQGHEADRVADQVTRIPDSGLCLAATPVHVSGRGTGRPASGVRSVAPLGKRFAKACSVTRTCYIDPMPATHAKPRPKTAYINARVTPSLKKEAAKVLASLGVSTTDAITMFLRQVVLHRGLPFPVRVPNSETVAAIETARKNPEATTTYMSVDAMMDDIWPNNS